MWEGVGVGLNSKRLGQIIQSIDYFQFLTEEFGSKLNKRNDQKVVFHTCYERKQSSSAPGAGACLQTPPCSATPSPQDPKRDLCMFHILGEPSS